MSATVSRPRYVSHPPLLVDPIAKRKYDIYVDDDNEIQLVYKQIIPRDYEFYNVQRTRLTHTADEFPRITQRLFDVHTTVGHDVMLEVRVRSHPDACTGRWYLDDKPITRRQPGNIDVRQWHPTSDGGVFVLYIRGAVASQSGVYACTAYNRAGAVRTAAFVDVAPAPVAGRYLPVRRLHQQRWF